MCDTKEHLILWSQENIKERKEEGKKEVRWQEEGRGRCVTPWLVRPWPVALAASAGRWRPSGDADLKEVHFQRRKERHAALPFQKMLLA